MIAFLSATALLLVRYLSVLMLVITVHELGHFLVARWLGVSVERFSIGFGRTIASWRDRGGVEWRLGWIPFGGYVRFTGDEDASSAAPDPEALAELKQKVRAERGAGAESSLLHFKPIWVRTLVVAAGPAANFILAIAIFAVLLAIFGETTLAARVGAVDPTGPAAHAGFKPGDLIVSANGEAIGDFQDLHQYVALRTGVPITFVVRRGAGTADVVATPQRHDEADPLTHTVSKLGYLGVRPSLTQADIIRRRYGPVKAVEAGVERSWNIVHTTVFYLSRLVRGKESGDQLGGPVRMAALANAAAQAGGDGAKTFGARLLGEGTALLYLAGVLSVGIGFMNLLPIPVLDGGHLVFYAYEALVRRPMAAQVQSIGYRVGLALLLGFMLFATWNDLLRLNLFKFLGGLFS